MTDLETDAVWAGSSQDSLAVEETGARVTESRGRRVSSLGDEVYYVLDTDYENFVVVYDCAQLTANERVSDAAVCSCKMRELMQLYSGRLL